MTFIKDKLKQFYFVPPTTLNLAAHRNLSRLDGRIKKFSQPRLLNLGCGERFVGRERISRESRRGLVNFDLFPLHSVDVAGDAHHIPFKDETFHAVITQALLEHTRRPRQVADEIFRLLKPGGLVYAEVPFIQGYHPTPRDYYRFTPEGIREVFSSFIIIEQGVCGGPGSALGWIFRETVSGIISGFSKKKALKTWGEFAAGWMASPFKYLDHVFAGKPEACKVASGLFILGRKE